MLTNKTIHKNLIEGHLLECVWTLIPGIILIQLALPSLVLLYTLEEFFNQKSIRIKCVGSQWFWSYDYPEFQNITNNIEFDSYMIQTKDLDSNNFRLLEVDNRLTLPALTSTQILVSRRDVLHSWAVPALGVKADAIPGRINQISLESQNTGVFFGQCSEICGANHSFIPIVTQFIPVDVWVKILNL